MILKADNFAGQDRTGQDRTGQVNIWGSSKGLLWSCVFCAGRETLCFFVRRFFIVSQRCDVK